MYLGRYPLCGMGGHVRISYDHLGRRVQKITPEATHTYFYDGWLLVKETRHPAASRSRKTREQLETRHPAAS